MQKVRALYHEYPQQFWLLIGATFIDALGGALLFPFLALYFTQKFEITLTQVGFIFTVFAIGRLFGAALGGALTDRYGRKKIVLFSLLASAASNVAMGLVTQFEMIYVIGLTVGVMASFGGPAYQAMVADLLPEAQRAEGFGLLRVVFNLAVVGGPIIGGLLAGVSYLLLFLIDAGASLVTATIVLIALRETMPTPSTEQKKETFTTTLRGYRLVFQDSVFMGFIFLALLLEIVYFQMNTTLAVYLRDFHDISTRYYGILLSLNAAMVVIMQFWVTRRIAPYPQLLMMAAAAILYGVGFGMFGVMTQFGGFVLAMIVITIGEMFWAPVSQALVARFSPEAMRGRYMAMFGLSFVIPSGLGPVLAGMIIDSGNPNWLWRLCFVLGTIAAFGYVWLHRVTHETAPTEVMEVVAG